MCCLWTSMSFLGEQAKTWTKNQTQSCNQQHFQVHLWMGFSLMSPLSLTRLEVSFITLHLFLAPASLIPALGTQRILKVAFWIQPEVIPLRNSPTQFFLNGSNFISSEIDTFLIHPPKLVEWPYCFFHVTCTWTLLASHKICMWYLTLTMRDIIVDLFWH